MDGLQASQRALEKQRAKHLDTFTRDYLEICLRPYQLEAAEAVLDSIRTRAGRSIVVMFSRQSGKDELSADLKTYLLARRHRHEVGIVEVNPTYKPQTINAIDRLEARLRFNRLTAHGWRKRSDFVRYVGRARVSFLSGDAEANVVGAVASLLLIVNEAQDIDPAVYDRNFAPMAASTNATRLFLGTAWTSRTLLARELRAARQAEQRDGVRRVFTYDAQAVRRVLPDYGRYVDEQVARLGRGHPLIRTQYFNEEIDAQAGMFTAARRALIQCDEPGPASPHADYWPVVFSIDVAGQDESTFHNPEEQYLRNPGRDAVSLTIASLDLTALETLQAPVFRVLQRWQWTGLNHLTVFARLKALADQWRPLHIVIDATGVGEGLWAMLDRHYPTQVRPVKFSAQKKSELGYRFIAMIETGRFKDCSFALGRAEDSSPGGLSDGVPGSVSSVTATMVDNQYAACVSEVLMGPQRTLRWGVPEGARDENGALIHDDIVMADAMLAEVDLLDWRLSAPALVIPRPDPLEQMSHF